MKNAPVNLQLGTMHVGYYGTSLTGKTTIARHNAQLLVKRGHQVIVYDPVNTDTVNGGWPEKAILFHEPEQFLRYASRCENAQLFVDEADTIFGHQLRENFWLMTRGRHQGLYVHLITQRPNLVHPSCRSQCGMAYICRLNKSDRAMILADHGQDDYELENYIHGDFIVVYNVSRDIYHGNIFELKQLDKRT